MSPFETPSPRVRSHRAFALLALLARCTPHTAGGTDAGPDAVTDTGLDARTLDAPTPTDASPATLLSSDFGSGSSAGWTPASGAWSVAPGDGATSGYCETVSTGEAITLAGDPTWTNYVAEATVRLGAGDATVGLLARAQDATTYYNLQLVRVGAAYTWGLYLNQGAAYRSLAGGPVVVPDGAPFTLRFTLVGTSLRADLVLDGGATVQALGTAADATLASGRVGLKTLNTAACFGPVVVRAVGPVAPVDAGTPPDVTTSDAAPTGRFHVAGTQILGPDGHPFVAHGVNINGLNWVWNRSDLTDLDAITNCWRFNLVRVNSYIKPVGTACADGQSPRPECHDNDNLDAIIAAFTARQIVVVLEAHDWTGDFPSSSDITLLANWHRGFAMRYRDNPYVWFNVMNEPGGGGAPAANARDAWLGVHQAVVRAIRDDAAADNVIIADGIGYAQENGYVSTADEPGESAILSYGDALLTFGGRTYPNIVFALHVYDQWTDFPTGTGQARMATYFDRVAARGFALIVGEYGVDNGTGVDDAPAVRALYADAVPRGIGRVVWHWWGAGDDLVNGGGAWNLDSCAAPGNLSPCEGQAAWDDNHGVAAPRCR